MNIIYKLWASMLAGVLKIALHVLILSDYERAEINSLLAEYHAKITPK